MLAYDKTLALLEYQMDKVEAFACRVLRMCHTLATIMVDTVYEPGGIQVRPPHVQFSVDHTANARDARGCME